jgi:hypothetical protein
MPDRIMRLMGYVDGAGLGPDGEGILNPIAVTWKADKRGLGDPDGPGERRRRRFPWRTRPQGTVSRKGCAARPRKAPAARDVWFMGNAYAPKVRRFQTPSRGRNACSIYSTGAMLLLDFLYGESAGWIGFFNLGQARDCGGRSSRRRRGPAGDGRPCCGQAPARCVRNRDEKGHFLSNWLNIIPC